MCSHILGALCTVHVSFMYGLASLVPRSIRRIGENGPVSTICTCAHFSNILGVQVNTQVHVYCCTFDTLDAKHQYIGAQDVHTEHYAPIHWQ